MASEPALGWPGLLLLAGGGCALPTPLGELSDPATTTETSSTTGTSTIGATSEVSTMGSTDGSSGETGTVGPFEVHAWVMRYDAYIDAAPDDGGQSDSGVGTDTGTSISPETLVVQISTGPDDCDDPWASLQCGEQWEVFMLIPPELQVPGTYLLFEELDAFFSATGPIEPGGDLCSGGGGTLEGQAELTVVSEQEVSGRLTMTNAFDFDANMTFTALGCG
ncbi:MAG: hypothetical protein KDK70_17875 [Myxococcales bacterium]|nr:hypothetical protein [Myxococcales bacterium]